ncbi:ATP-binding cassette domain-containing protein [Lentzea flaviverrucosa]|uniref:ABC-2 type transport system ATP-binding protein n=1 Tax=Lentzea flaviverrucosa TaxID=200379 RepID=A0A1H9XEX6_9PSEU|nr:ABC transporter ATP-binding protein [Lentzea flaviverrucosa]RDI21488.1 ABC-2 type transport system ATP-binding protein [Lentzea flaviverrucosa]SES44599.1 ABC-2 type transport system ATP-binding protein [Lentzea flaviverrucosa]
MNPLTATALGKRYGTHWAVRDCGFTIPEGKVVALVGPNGAGKSTLLRMAAGLVRPTTGELTAFGTPVRGRIHQDVSFLAQNRPLHRDLEVRELVRYCASMNDRWSAERAHEVLALQAGVDQDAKVGTLSAGGLTQVAIALALGRLPRLLLLDEPLADLDPLARDETLRIIMAEVADRGTTVVMSSHLLSDLREVCDHLLLVDEGRVQVSGDIEEVLAEHRILVGPPADESAVEGTLISATRTERQSTLLLREARPTPEGWAGAEPDLESLVMGYLRASRERRSSAERG